MILFKWIAIAAVFCGAIGPVMAEEQAPRTLGGATDQESAGARAPVYIFDAENGMMTEIVETALSAAGLTVLPDLNFVPGETRIELAAAAFDDGVIFPMYMPRCDDEHLLTRRTAALCKNFKWSAPLFHVITAMYVAADASWTPQSDDDLAGRTICLLGGKLGHLAHWRGLTEGDADLVTGRSPADCLEQVADGASDIALLPMIGADAALRRTGLAKEIRHAPALDGVLCIHAIARRSDAIAIADIFALNEGLAKIRANGDWFEIVKEHFSRQRRGIAQN